MSMYDFKTLFFFISVICFYRTLLRWRTFSHLSSTYCAFFYGGTITVIVLFTHVGSGLTGLPVCVLFRLHSRIQDSLYVYLLRFVLKGRAMEWKWVEREGGEGGGQGKHVSSFRFWHFPHKYSPAYLCTPACLRIGRICVAVFVHGYKNTSFPH